MFTRRGSVLRSACFGITQSKRRLKAVEAGMAEIVGPQP